MPRRTESPGPLLRLLAPLLCALLVIESSAQGERSYRMYRNPPKPRLVVLPVVAGHLPPATRGSVDQALAREARIQKAFQVTSLPAGIAVDSSGDLSPEALAVLGSKHRIDLLLRARLEKTTAGHALSLAIHDTRAAARGEARARAREECACGPEELISTRLPEAVRRLSGSQRLRGMRCEERMAVIPGAAQAAADAEEDSSRVPGPGAFCMDLYEYPNLPAGEPVVEKDWKTAESLCSQLGKRLCTETEWELACSGWSRHTYPYGNAYDSTRCNTASMTILLSGGNGLCRSPFGVFDLSGNVYEWTASEWSSKYHDKVVKGGNWSAGAENSACRARFGQPAATATKAIGFRCCMSLEP